MAITNRDQLVNALLNSSNNSRVIIDKASIANTVAGQFHSLFRATGQPGQGAIPTAAAVCNNNLLGAMNFTQQVDPATSYFVDLEGSNGSNNSTTMEIHDRLMHMGGLVANIATSQVVNLDLNANLATDNLDARKGDSNFSDVQWWLEWYGDTGATAANLTINVTYHDGTSGDLTLVAVGGTVRASRMIPLNSLIPAAASSKFIRDVNSATLSVSTGTAGNFGFTATRLRASLYKPIAFGKFEKGLNELNNEIKNGACLFPLQIAGSTTTGAVRASGKIIHG
jgi:hypothetical protein